MFHAFIGGWCEAWRGQHGRDGDKSFRFLVAWIRTGRGKVIKTEHVAKSVGMPRSTAYRIASAFEQDFANFAKSMESNGLPIESWLLGTNLPAPESVPDLDET